MGTLTQKPPHDRSPESLRKDPHLLSAILEASGLLVVVLDPHARIVLFNRACENLTGYSADEVKGKPIWDLLPREEVDDVGDVFQAILRGNYPNEHVNFWVGRDGRRCLVRWSNTALRDADGNVSWVIGTGIDISDVRRTNESLYEARQRAQAVLKTAVDGIVIIDTHGTIETFNPAAERLFGYAAEEVIGRNVGVLMPSPHREQHDNYIRRYLETGERRIIGIGREVSGRRKDGTTFPMELAVGEVQLPDRRLFTGIVRDITRRKRAEEQARKRLDDLAHASRLTAMGEMASGVAHELNQPLAAIVSYADACLRLQHAGEAKPEVMERALKQIAEQGFRAGEIVGRLREFARKRHALRAPLGLNQTLRYVLEVLDHEIQRRGMPVRLALDERLPAVQADRVQIEQVILNLVRNALESMDERGLDEHSVLQVVTRRKGNTVELAITDTGVGLPPDADTRVFETFFTTKPNGMGMGLSVSRSIVEAHGGELQAEPNHGPGATFRLALPVDPQSGPDGG